MAGDVSVRINNSVVGNEGACIINPNSLTIVPSFSSRQRLVSAGADVALSDAALSGQYVNRFDDTTYYG
jgi:hypothetical protein